MTVRIAGELVLMSARGEGPLANAPADAPVFVVLPTVQGASEAVWRLEETLRRLGASPSWLDSIRESAIAIEEWQDRNPTLVKVPGR